MTTQRNVGDPGPGAAAPVAPVALAPAPAQPIDASTAKWASLLPKITLALIIVGVIIGAIVFWTVGTTAGEDVGALIWVATFAGAVALMSIRQLLLAERE